MIKIGMIIGERYEIIEKIGTGGMSDVYKAKCHKLNRFVAVKVLKQEFSENANFVSKFRIEAQAAAGLMHPNIVNVYDVGEENGIYYIVMELVEGITLKKYIEKKARLSYKEAVSVAIQVALGIEAAHNNHIIHRDIKPQNIIISKEGKVKVTDFGIAKAASSNTITSNVMGSVHYTSPEQARGGYSDEKSDVYSLGITIFEMLTGRVPFNGETTVAIAIKHIQEEMPSPRDYVSEIPLSVEQIVLKCCQKSPDRRYQSVPEVIEDLKQSLLYPDDDFVKIIVAGEDAPTQMLSAQDVDQIKRQTDKRDSLDDALRLRSETEEIEYEGSEDDYEEDYSPKVEKVMTILGIIVVILIFCVIIVLVGKIFGAFDFSKDNEDNNPQIEQPANLVEMISVAGNTVEEAKRQLMQLNLIPEVTYVESDNYESGIVISADVSVGTMLEEGSTVVLTVSSGTQGIEVPKVTGLSKAEAVSTLESLGFVVNPTESYSEEVAKGNIISQTPEAGNKAPSGSAVTIRISLGKEETKVRVPSVLNLTEMDAIVKLTEAGLVVGNITPVNHNEIAADLVCYQSESEGSYVEEGTRIDLRISMGPEAKTYFFEGSIEAPTVMEDPDYKEGITVDVTMVASDGTPLLSTRTNSFPIANLTYRGIKSSTGVITFTYVITTESTTTIDEETGEEMVIPGETIEKIVTREIVFTEE